jgi:membrane protease subunit (stomatin/prohibitin family)
MKKFAKWIVILWSLFCLFGVIFGMINVGKNLDMKNEYERAGSTIGLGCGMGMWVGIWLAIAGPSMFIYAIASNKEKKTEIPMRRESKLCKECGKYYEGNPNFCPNCGKQI